MSAPVGPGDWVECIDNGAGPYSATPELTVGSLYQIEALLAETLNPSCLLVGHPNPRQGAFFGGVRINGYSLRRFRPVYRPKAELIERLKAPPKAAKPKTPQVERAKSREDA